MFRQGNGTVKCDFADFYRIIVPVAELSGAKLRSLRMRRHKTGRFLEA